MTAPIHARLEAAEERVRVLEEGLRSIRDECNHVDWNGQGVTWAIHDGDQNDEALREVARFCGPCAARTLLSAAKVST